MARAVLPYACICEITAVDNGARVVLKASLRCEQLLPTWTPVTSWKC